VFSICCDKIFSFVLSQNNSLIWNIYSFKHWASSLNLCALLIMFLVKYNYTSLQWTLSGQQQNPCFFNMAIYGWIKQAIVFVWAFIITMQDLIFLFIVQCTDSPWQCLPSSYPSEQSNTPLHSWDKWTHFLSPRQAMWFKGHLISTSSGPKKNIGRKECVLTSLF
jgi:hypothetical protein